MKKKHLILLCIVSSFLCCFLFVGYAQLSDTLTVIGDADVSAQENVFISDATPSAGDVTVVRYIASTLSSTVTLTETDGATATVHITLYNNSSYVYTFNNVKYIEGEETYDNMSITFSLDGLKKGDEIAAQGNLEFDLIFSYSDGAVSNTTLNSILNFEFVPADEYIPEIAVNGALDKFEQILNNTEDYEALTNRMDDTSGKYNDSYVGNVVGATTADTVFLEELFTEDGQNYLTLDIGGTTTSVTTIIKREDLDGDGVMEMTIYLTAGKISGIIYFSSIDVYAATFKTDGEGNWTQIGELYSGTARVNSYGGGLTANSFNTDTWRSATVYYGVASGSNIDSIYAASPKN